MRPAEQMPDKTMARRSFEAAAARYDQAAGLQQEVGERLLQRLELKMLCWLYLLNWFNWLTNRTDKPIDHSTNP